MMKRMLSAAVLMGASLFSTSALAQQGGQQPGQRVLVIPFTALNVPESEQWISKGVMESLVADLGRTPGVVPIAFQGQVVVEDNATAVRLARQANSSLVIRGATQAVGNNVRLTAQVIDAKTGDTIQTASVTGAAADTLKLEDDLMAQLRNTTGPAATASAPAAATTGAYPATPPMPAIPQAPQIIVIAPPSQSYGDNGYSSYAGYPSYPYGGYPYDYAAYGGFYPGLLNTVVFTNGRDHFRGQVFCNTGIGNLHFIGRTGPTVGPLTPNIPGSALVPNISGPALVPNVRAPVPSMVNFGAAGFGAAPRGGGFVSQRGR